MLSLKKQVGREKQLTVIQGSILFFIGISGGFITAAGTFAFITMLQIIPRLASRTHTANCILFYEDCFILGGVLGNIVFVYELSLPIGIVGLLILTTGAGVFVGCLAIALAEIIDVIPVFASRIKLKVGVPYVVLSLALGKGLSSFYQLVINR